MWAPFGDQDVTGFRTPPGDREMRERIGDVERGVKGKLAKNQQNKT